MSKQQIQSDVKDAMKQGNSEVTGVLRMVLAAISAKEKEKRYTTAKEKPDLKEEELVKVAELADGEVMDVISSEVKKRKDAIVLYEKGGRPELAEVEKKEIEILKKYLPEQLSEQELRKIIEESMEKVGAKEIKDMGRVMSDLAPKVKGKADNSQISSIIKELLSK